MNWINILNTILLMLFITTILGDHYFLGDFCDIYDCGPQHIACNFTQGQKGDACPETVGNFLINITMEELILKLHNDERNNVAKGRAAGLLPATRMAAMSWDRLLYTLATIKALECTLEPDPCHPTDLFKYSGQNLGQFDYPGDYGNVSVDEAVSKIITKWLLPDQHITQEIVDQFPESLQNTTIDTYALMINERNTHVGCGISWIKLAEQQNRILLVCYYATKNFVGSRIYKSGRTASECRTGLQKYKRLFGLCSVRENYNYEP